MGSPSGGVGGSNSAGGSGGTGGPGGNDNDRGGPSGSGGNDNDRGGPSGSDRDSSNDGSGTSRADSSNDGRADSSQRGMTGSERTGGSFDDAMSSAAGSTFGGLTDPADSDDDRTADDAARAAARDNHLANEFSGLGSSGGPIDNGLSGDDSRNSHRGFGPDDTVAGGIDDGVNAGLADDQAAKQTDAADLVGPAGYGAAGLQGGLEAYRDHIDRNARHGAANTLTKGNAGNLPGRADLAKTITEPRMTTSKALDVTPYGPDAKSTQQLATGANTASTVGKYANRVGLGVQPAAGAIQGYVNTPENASWTERATNTLVGAVKEFDDTGVSYAAGGFAAGGTIAASPLTGPAAPAVAVSAPAVGVGAAIAAGEAYNNGSVDKAVDGFVEDYVRPGAQATFDAIDDYVVDPINGLVDRVFGSEDGGADKD